MSTLKITTFHTTDKNGGCNNEYAKNNNISHSFIFMNIKLSVKVYLYEI